VKKLQLKYLVPARKVLIITEGFENRPLFLGPWVTQDDFCKEGVEEGKGLHWKRKGALNTKASSSSRFSLGQSPASLNKKRSILRSEALSSSPEGQPHRAWKKIKRPKNPIPLTKYQTKGQQKNKVGRSRGQTQPVNVRRLWIPTEGRSW